MSTATLSNHPTRRHCSKEVNKRAWILHCCYFSEQDWRRQLHESTSSSLNLSCSTAYFYQEDSMSSSAILLSGHPQSIQMRSTNENRCLYKILKHGIFLKSVPCKSRLNSEKTTGNHRYVASQNICS